jgi:hypothetical protein
VRDDFLRVVLQTRHPGESRGEGERLRATGAHSTERPAMDGRAGVSEAALVSPWTAAENWARLSPG